MTIQEAIRKLNKRSFKRAIEDREIMDALETVMAAAIKYEALIDLRHRNRAAVAMDRILYKLAIRREMDLDNVLADALADRVFPLCGAIAKAIEDIAPGTSIVINKYGYSLTPLTASLKEIVIKNKEV